MSSKIFTALVTLFLAAPAHSAAQHHGELPGQALAPTLNSAALLPGRGPDRKPFGEHLGGPLTTQGFGGGEGSSVLVRAIVLAGASLGGLWAGRQIPLPPADDDSDLSVGHLITSPVASVIAVSAASALLGHGLSPSASLLGGAAGFGAGLLASMVTGDAGIALTYAGVHGLVTALMTR